MTATNEAIAYAIGSASFLLTAVALLLTAIALALGAWAHWRAKQADVETTRLELSYRLMLAASGGGDARLPRGNEHYSSIEVQTMAIAALRSFPENHDVYERLLSERERQVQVYPDNETVHVLRREMALLVTHTESKRKKS